MREAIQFGHGSEKHSDSDQISAFVEHALPAHEREEMLAHLAVCPECRATVRLSQAALEEAAEPVAVPVEVPKRRRWFAGWAVAWPVAGALVGMVVLGIYMRREAAVRRGANQPTQLAESHAPVRPEMEEPRTSKPAPVQDVKEKQAERAGESLAAAGAKTEQNLDAKKASSVPAPAAGGLLQSTNIIAAEEGFAGNAPMARPAASPAGPTAGAQQEPAAGAMRQTLRKAIGGPREVSNASLTGLALDQMKVAPALHPLPSGFPVLSLATHGRQAVAIDARNAVFASADGGAHWTAVPTVWTGRAVKADLVSYGMSGGTGVVGGRMAEFASTNRVVQQAQAEPVPAPSGAVTQGSELTGTVRDASGAAVGGATVTVTDGAGRTAGAAVADQAGRFRLGGLAPGTYDVTTQAPGFEQQTLQAVVIPSRPNEADVSLKVGEASETVEVETNADALDKSHPAPPKALAKSSARSSAPPVFEITTDNGDRWTSPDGLVWMRK
jgi:carboxypeptidase family protein/putative zinc finger protein